MQIFQLQQAQLEVKSASSDESSALGQFIDSIKASTSKVQDTVNKAIPLQKGKSRSWLSTSRLQENVKKVNPFGRSKSIPVTSSDREEESDPGGHNQHSILSFTAITESLSASSEDISDALGRKFERLLNSALSPPSDDTSPAVHLLHVSDPKTGKVRTMVRSASSPSAQSNDGSKSLWSDMLPAVFRTTNSNDDTTATAQDSYTSQSESTLQDPTAQDILNQIATDPSSNNDSPSASLEWELDSKEMLSLLDESDDDEAENDTDDEDDSSCSAGSMDGSILTTESGIEVAFQEELRSIGGVLFRASGAACTACKLQGQGGAVNDDQFSVTSGTFPEIPNQQTRGRSRSPRPYSPAGMEFEPPSVDEMDETNDVSMKPPAVAAAVQQESQSVLQTMFGCTGSQFLP